jgi:hypothetical protein
MTDPSGYSTLCCDENQYNGGGICCNEGTEFCAGSCCPGTCNWLESDPGSPTCTATVAGCDAAGGSGALCNTSSDCGTGSHYCSDGCCYTETIIP